MDKESMDWQLYGQAAEELAELVRASGFKPDIILGVARGGLFGAGSLAYALGVKNLYIMNLEFYTGEGETLDVPVMLPPYIDVDELKSAKVLVVDDIADTGKTLRSAHNHCKSVVTEAHTAVLYEKPESLVKCSFVWKRVPQDTWIEFPWD